MKIDLKDHLEFAAAVLDGKMARDEAIITIVLKEALDKLCENAPRHMEHAGTLSKQFLASATPLEISVAALSDLADFWEGRVTAPE